jgi:iron(III) transport system substrate-binding protein
VLVVNTKLVGEAERPSSIWDLTDPKWKDKCGMAKPLAGTTATHAACLFAAWGDEKAKEFFRAVKQNARVLGGNRQVAQAVGAGELAFGLTDTDDALAELESGRPVAIVFPDQSSVAISLREMDPLAERENYTGLGTLIIPNTLSILHGAEHRGDAERLVEYLLSPAVEERLAKGPSAQIPLNPAVKEKSRVEPAEPIRRMKVDFEAAAKKWDEAAVFLRDEFLSAR